MRKPADSDWKTIEKDWFGKDGAALVEYALLIDDQALTFWARCNKSPWYTETNNEGDFLPELWKMDVAEFFLKDDTSDYYQEFNLAPSGAWWSGLFSSYREPAEDAFIPPLVKCHSQVSEDSWEAAIELQRKDLKVDISFGDSSRGNVCFIIGKDEDKQFFTAGDLGDGKPDFHRVMDFPELTMIW